MMYTGEEENDALYSAEKYDNGQVVYGIGVITVDEEKSYLIQKFEPSESYVDNINNVIGMTSSVVVRTDSIVKLYKGNKRKLTLKTSIGSIIYDDFK